MAGKKINVLVGSIGSTGSINIVKTLKSQRKYRVRVYGIDCMDNVAGKYLCDGFQEVPRGDHPDYISAVLELCENRGIDIFIPIFMEELLSVSDNRKLFAGKGIMVPMSERRVIDVCRDKSKTNDFFRKHEIPHIPFITAEEAAERFPVFVKPRTGRGTTDCFKAENEKELKFYLDKLKDPVIQEYVSGDEYSIDAFNDLEGRFIGAVPRERQEMKGGIAVKTQTVYDKELIEYTEKITTSLGLVGASNIQCFRTPEKVLFFEVNPRFGGSYILSIKAGLNAPLFLLDMFKGNTPDYEGFQDSLYMVRYWTEEYVKL